MVREKLTGLSRDALVYGVGDALGKVIGIVMLPILSRIFGPAEYGAIDLLMITYTFVLMLLRLGVPTGVQRFYYREQEIERGTLVTSSLVYMLLVTTGVAVLLAVFAGPLATLFDGDRTVVRASIVVLATMLPFEQAWTYLVLLLRLERRPIAFSLGNVTLVVLTPLFTVLFVVQLGLDVQGVFLARLLAIALVTVALAWTLRGRFGRKVQAGVFARVVRFALPGHPALMIVQAMNVAPRYLLAAFAPLSAVGLFGIASRVGSMLRIYVDAFNRAWNPFAYANEGAADEGRLYEVVLRGFFASLVVIGLAMSVFAPELLALLTPAGYAGAAPLVPGVVVYLCADGLVIVFSTLLYTRDRVRWASYFGVVKLAVFLIAGLSLVPRWQAMGLVTALMISGVVHALIYVIAARRLFPLPIPLARMLVVLASAVLAWFATDALHAPLAFVLLAKTAALGIVTALAIGLLVARSERRQLALLFARRDGGAA